MAECLFCRILSKEIPATIVHEDEDVIVFKDIAPQAPIHLLIVPKRHIASLNELSGEDGALIGRLFLVATKVARDLGVASKGYRLVTNCGPDAGQTVFHLHVHLLAGASLMGRMG